MHIYIEENWNQNQYMVVIIEGEITFKAYIDKYQTTVAVAILKALSLYDSRRFKLEQNRDNTVWRFE